MNSPELYIFVALGFAFALSWIVSRFNGLAIDLFNTSIGLLFGASANLALMANTAFSSVAAGTKQTALTDYALFLVFLQFAFGIIIISTYLAARQLSSVENPDTTIKIKEAVFYSGSFVMSLLSCYVMTVFFLNSKQIFAPVSSNSGELNIIVNRFVTASYIPVYYWALPFIITTLFRYGRGPISSLARP